MSDLSDSYLDARAVELTEKNKKPNHYLARVSYPKGNRNVILTSKSPKNNKVSSTCFVPNRDVKLAAAQGDLGAMLLCKGGAMLQDGLSNAPYSANLKDIALHYRMLLTPSVYIEKHPAIWGPVEACMPTPDQVPDLSKRLLQGASTLQALFKEWSKMDDNPLKALFREDSSQPKRRSNTAAATAEQQPKTSTSSPAQGPSRAQTAGAGGSGSPDFAGRGSFGKVVPSASPLANLAVKLAFDEEPSAVLAPASKVTETIPKVVRIPALDTNNPPTIPAARHASLLQRVPQCPYANTQRVQQPGRSKPSAAGVTVAAPVASPKAAVGVSSGSLTFASGPNGRSEQPRGMGGGRHLPLPPRSGPGGTANNSDPLPDNTPGEASFPSGDGDDSMPAVLMAKENDKWIRECDRAIRKRNKLKKKMESMDANVAEAEKALQEATAAQTAVKKQYEAVCAEVDEKKNNIDMELEELSKAASALRAAKRKFEEL